jgi:DNA modification methylase
MLKWGSLPPWYESAPERSVGVMGGKPLGLMRAIVRDYTRPGDLVVDPFCGGGTTALACAIEGRRCITSEMDPKTFELARKRLEKGYTTDMFSG